MPIIKTLNAPQQKREIVQIIDGVQFSTIRAALIHDNGKGEALYFDARPERVAAPVDHARTADVQPEPCYFLLRATAMGPTFLYGIQPLTDAEAKAWAKANDASTKLGKGAAVANVGGAAAVRKQLIGARRQITQVMDGIAYSTNRAALIHDTSDGQGQATPDTEALFYDPAPQAMFDNIPTPSPTYFLVKQVMHGGLMMLAIQPLSDADALKWAKAHGVADRLTVGKSMAAASVAKLARESVKKGTTPLDAMKLLVKQRPDDVAELLVRRFVR